MPRRASKHPTELELEILKVLWERGASTGREVRDALAAVRDLAATTVATVLGIMEEKGYVRRNDSDRGILFAPRLKRDAALRGLLRDIVDRAFGGSTAAAMVHLLQAGDVDAEELRRLRELIDRKRREASP